MDNQLWKEFQAKLKKNGATSVYSARGMLVQEFLQLETTRRLSNDSGCSERSFVDRAANQNNVQGLQTPTSPINISSHSISRSPSSDHLEKQERSGSLGGSPLLVDSMPRRIETSQHGEAHHHKHLFESFVHDIVGRARAEVPRPRAQRRFSLPSFGMTSERNIVGASTLRRTGSKDSLPSLLLQLGLHSVEKAFLADGNSRIAPRSRTSSMDCTTTFPRQSRRHSVGGMTSAYPAAVDVSHIPCEPSVKQSTQYFLGVPLDNELSMGINKELRVKENDKERVGTVETIRRAARRMSAPHSYLLECSDPTDSVMGVREIDVGDDIKSFAASDSNLLVSFPTKPRRRTSLLGNYTENGTKNTREMNTSIASWDLEVQKPELFDLQFATDADCSRRASSSNLPPAGSTTEIESQPFMSVDSDKLRDSPLHFSQDCNFVSAA
ncbi:hypothetical protein MHU86_11903 [Fragilaria crotonensis]|nr:hypothetical protein MHU86_11903 [Fragilaria crotonensis]